MHHITKYLDGKEWSQSMEATAMERIKTAVNWAVSQQYIDKKYKLEIPKSLRPKQEHRKLILTPEQQAKVEAAANPSMRAILQGLRPSGTRPGELCGALIEKCDLEAGMLMVLNKTRNTTDMEYRPLYLSA